MKGEPMKKQCAALAAAMTISTAALADGWSIYGGADYVLHEVSITVPANPDRPLGPNDRNSGDGESVRLRVGMWLDENFAIEVQGSVSSETATGPDVAELDSYYGVFLNVRAQPFEWLDMVFPLGVASVEATVPDGDGNFITAKNDGVAYGVNFQLNLGRLVSGDADSIMSGFGIGTGFMVYNSSKNANVRGYNFGVFFGYDF